MDKIDIVFVARHSGELDRVTVEVRNTGDCAREVLDAVAREKWVLSVGDRIELSTHE